ncbi:hypothetical protein K435DRAFT_849219 [Dendrothele bispora CBS 962.96]|uniref:Uncharacterized protein n=1 Tax=Dendrothele bispora (strain CBS 962.96) TaxID=1314807 RepID=A0A4S8MSJ0_DENBC|nr:hypothetical protein K435DRAFT_849219 [Dendrothele bispora CBS 962.96]
MARIKLTHARSGSATHPSTSNEAKPILTRRIPAMIPRPPNHDFKELQSESDENGKESDMDDGQDEMTDSEEDDDSSVMSVEPGPDYEDYLFKKNRGKDLLQWNPHLAYRLPIDDAIYISPSAFELDEPGPMHLTHLLLSPSHWSTLKTQDQRFQALSLCIGETRAKELFKTGKRNLKTDDQMSPATQKKCIGNVAKESIDKRPNGDLKCTLCGEEGVFLIHRDWLETEEEYNLRQDRRKQKRKARFVHLPPVSCLSVERGTRSGRPFSPWVISEVLSNNPDQVPLYAPRIFDLERAMANAESARAEREAEAEEDVENGVLDSDLGSASADLNLPLSSEDASSFPSPPGIATAADPMPSLSVISRQDTEISSSPATSTTVDPTPSLALDSCQDSEAGPARGKKARRERAHAKSREKRRLKVTSHLTSSLVPVRRPFKNRSSLTDVSPNAGSYSKRHPWESSESDDGSDVLALRLNSSTSKHLSFSDLQHIASDGGPSSTTCDTRVSPSLLRSCLRPFRFFWPDSSRLHYYSYFPFDSTYSSPYSIHC